MFRRKSKILKGSNAAAAKARPGLAPQTSDRSIGSAGSGDGDGDESRAGSGAGSGADDDELASSPIKQWLQRVPVFASLSREALRAVTAAMTCKGTGAITFGAGTTVFSEGDAGDEMYFVCSGELEVSVGGEVVSVLHDGAYCGEDEVIMARGERAATVRVAGALGSGRAELLPLRRATLLEALAPFRSATDALKDAEAARSRELGRSARVQDVHPGAPQHLIFRPRRRKRPMAAADMESHLFLKHDLRGGIAAQRRLQRGGGGGAGGSRAAAAAAAVGEAQWKSVYFCLHGQARPLSRYSRLTIAFSYLYLLATTTTN